MAKIPQYTSRESLTTQSGSGYMKPQKYGIQQDPATAAKMSGGAAMEQIGNVFNELSEKILRIDIANAESKGNILRTQAYAAYQDKVNKDPDIKHSMDDFDSVMSDTKEQYLELFDDPRAKTQAGLNFDLDSALFGVKLKAGQAKRLVAEADLLGQRDLLLRGNELAILTDEADREAKKTEMLNLAKEKENSGVWTPGLADINYKKAINDSVNTAMAVNPEFTLKELEKGSSGAYKEIPEAERKILAAKNKDVLKKLMDESEVFSLQQQLDFQKGFDEKIPNMNIGNALTELESGAESGRYNAKWADAKKRSLLTTVGISKDKADDYENDIIMRISALQDGYDILEKGQKKQLKHLRPYLKEVQSIATAIEDGKAKGLLVDVDKLKTSLYDKSTAKATQASVQGGRPWHTNIADAEKAYLPVMGAADRYAALRDYFFQTDGKDLLEERKKAIIEQAVITAQQKNFPDYSGVEVGDVVNTKFGPRTVTGIDKDGMLIIDTGETE